MERERTSDTSRDRAAGSTPAGHPARRESGSRRSPQDWLVGGLESLSEEGISGLRTERLASKLRLTTGSFYWHFRSRADFERKLLAHWERHMTGQVLEEMAQSEESPLERLHALFARVQEERLARYETPVRAWALVEPRAAEAVAKVDTVRLAHVVGLLRELGFEGDDVEMRARTLLLCGMAEPSCFLSDTDRDRARWLRARVDLVVGAAASE